MHFITYFSVLKNISIPPAFSRSLSLSLGGSLIHESRSRPSGNGTFFWAFGATGLSSPWNRKCNFWRTSSPRSKSFTACFTKASIQHALSWTSRSPECTKIGSLSIISADNRRKVSSLHEAQMPAYILRTFWTKVAWMWGGSWQALVRSICSIHASGSSRRLQQCSFLEKQRQPIKVANKKSRLP